MNNPFLEPAPLSFLQTGVLPKPKPYCTCTRAPQGFRDAGDGLWVHSLCGKPTKMFLDAYEARRQRKDRQ